MNIRIPAAPITAVAMQPRVTGRQSAVKALVTDFGDTRMMIATISGTATTPLMTALQNNAFIGLIGGYWMTIPTSTLTAILPLKPRALAALRSRPHFQFMASHTAYAAEPASTGTPIRPTTRMPSANSVKAKSPPAPPFRCRSRPLHGA
jgi:hypothetical protein